MNNYNKNFQILTTENIMYDRFLELKIIQNLNDSAHANVINQWFVQAQLVHQTNHGIPEIIKTVNDFKKELFLSTFYGARDIIE